MSYSYKGHYQSRLRMNLVCNPTRKNRFRNAFLLHIPHHHMMNHLMYHPSNKDHHHNQRLYNYIHNSMHHKLECIYIVFLQFVNTIHQYLFEIQKAFLL